VDDRQRVLDELEHRGAHAFPHRERTSVRRGLATLVHRALRPVAHSFPVVRRVAEPPADHDRRQSRRQSLDRLALTLRRDRVDETARDLAHFIFLSGHRTRREAAVDQRSVRLVERIVLVDHRRVVGLIDVRARPVVRGVVLRVLLDVHHVFEARDAPQLLHRVPEDRRVVAQPAVRVPRIDVEVRIEQVDVRLIAHAPLLMLAGAGRAPKLRPSFAAVTPSTPVRYPGRPSRARSV
jgi:hypothetical protein